ncbi:MAG: site-specific DNA-methyltransferase, partial [Peptococcaceae bacterium]|nr:site-specific DNA-methyltransferase [Peptococcaceae bacterium]
MAFKDTEQITMLDQKQDTKNQPVTCLGMTFENDEARRTYFTEELRKRLPELKQMEGFPVGEDEDILALSDPPYYTACPNPFIPDFIKQWEEAKKQLYGEDQEEYHREPFAADVAEGKNDPLYNAHSYHTKVPHKAIMRYILHYTEPGDIVFDSFCGTGMTGVAAQMCGDRNMVMELGYQVKPDGTILREETDEDGKNTWVAFSKLGARRAVLNDLSPAATFIAKNYTQHGEVAEFQERISKALHAVKQKLGWMYETENTETGTSEELLFCVWSDVFLCPECGGDIPFCSTALNDVGKIEGNFHCPHCDIIVSKSSAEHAYETIYEPILNTTRLVSKSVPVEVCCKKKDTNSKYMRPVNQKDLEVLTRVQEFRLAWHPVNKMMFKDHAWGDQWRRGYHSDVTHDYHFFLKRPLAIIAEVRAQLADYLPGLFLITATMLGLSRLQRYTPGSTFPNMIRSGTLYIGSLHREWNALSWIEGKTKGITRMYEKVFNAMGQTVVTTQSASCLLCQPNSSADYIFLDPPFGDNLAYSELNFLWEGWLKVFTRQRDEAIVSKHQSKGLNEYRALMAACFKEAYRVLKPGRWMTVEFSNTRASVWNSIQTALAEAGFIVANLSALDKQQGSFNAITTPTS